MIDLVGQVGKDFLGFFYNDNLYAVDVGEVILVNFFFLVGEVGNIFYNHLWKMTELLGKDS